MIAREASHLSNLDGLRTLAAFSVLFSHCDYFAGVAAPGTPWDWIRQFFFHEAGLGVQFFFVLSGFLITRIVLREQDSPRGFRVRDFWIRRILRIWPVYFVVVTVAWLLSYSGWPPFNMENNSWLLTLTFLANIDLTRLYATGTPYGYVTSVLWSVSIEEQFYLVYPLTLNFLPRRLLIPFFCLVVLLAVVLRKTLGLGQFHTISACYELGVGCLLGLLAPSAPRWASRIPKALLLLPYLTIGLTIFTPPKGIYWAFHFLRPFLFAAVLFDQAFCTQSCMQTKKVPFLNDLGKITYGLYCYHMIFVILVLEWMRRLGCAPVTVVGFLLYVAIVSVISIGVSAFSYRWLETPILAYKPK